MGRAPLPEPEVNSRYLPSLIIDKNKYIATVKWAETSLEQFGVGLWIDFCIWLMLYATVVVACVVIE